MIKKIDLYILKTFFGPFLFIFSVLFFIFIVNVVWIQMSQLTGKGLTTWEIMKLLLYIGVTVIKMVLPLTILLSAIMTFGDFGEHYELAAMKSAGISLLRVMRPLFFVTILLSILLYFFSNNVIPDFNKKAKNMLFNVASTRPALNFDAGQFSQTVPGMSIKFDKIEGKNGENVKGVFIHKITGFSENPLTVIAKSGKFTPATNRKFLKLTLYDGYYYQDQIANKDYKGRTRQENQSIKFDTLVQHFDISQLIDKALEEQNITDDYQFQSFRELNKTIKKKKAEDKETFKSITNDLVGQQSYNLTYTEPAGVKPKKASQPYNIDTLKNPKKLKLLYSAYKRLENFNSNYQLKDNYINDTIKFYSKMVIYQQSIVAYSVTCIIFYLIGASLGSIIRKGGVGLPVIFAIIIFIIFYVISQMVNNTAARGNLNPYFASWLPNLILLPFGIWLTYKALTDSQLFDVEKYKAMFKPLVSRFIKNKEHERYQ